MHFHKSLTLLELLIAITLIGLVALGFFSIDLFSRHNVISSDRRVTLQNEVSYILGHMQKEISKGIGNEQINGTNGVVDITDPPGNNKARIKVYIDGNQNGLRDNSDYWIGYRFYDQGPKKYQIRYCANCGNGNSCTQCAPGYDWDIMSKRILNFTPTKPIEAPSNILNENYVGVNITACWDPDGIPDECGTSDNPSVTMQSRIHMPLVSTH